MDIPVIAGSRLRYRIRWRLVRLLRHQDGFEVGLFGHPALRLAMTVAGFEFSQIDWYSLTLSYKRRRLLADSEDKIEPARLLLGLASQLFGFVYLGIYLSDWGRMLPAGQLPVEVGRLGVDARHYRDPPRPAQAAGPTIFSTRPYQTDDLEPCRALWTALVEHHRRLYADPTIGGEAPGLCFDRHLTRCGSGRLWVATGPGGAIAGLVGLLVEGDEAEVEPIVVAPGERGKGAGRALLECALAEARALRMRYLNVRPVARNAEAIGFFHEAGFRLLGRVELFMDLGDTPGDWQPGPELGGRRFAI